MFVGRYFAWNSPCGSWPTGRVSDLSALWHLPPECAGVSTDLCRSRGAIDAVNPYLLCLTSVVSQEERLKTLGSLWLLSGQPHPINAQVSLSGLRQNVIDGHIVTLDALSP